MLLYATIMKQDDTPLPWTVYILECADSTLYTGLTNDLPNRLAKHADGTGAKYTRGRGPYKVIYTERCETKNCALKREAEIKSMNRKGKLTLASHISSRR